LRRKDDGGNGDWRNSTLNKSRDDALIDQVFHVVRTAFTQWFQRIDTPFLLKLCIASLVVRFCFVVVVHPPFHAAEDYNIALHLARGDGFAYGGFDHDWYKTALKAPIYPMVLSVFVRLFGKESKFIVALVQHALFAFLPLLMFRIGQHLKLESIGAIAALLFLFHPSYLYYPTVIEATNLSVPLAVLWFERYLRMHNVRLINQLLFSFLSGVLILTQPLALVPIGIAIIWRFRSWWKTLTLVCSVILLLIGSWTLRNWLTFHEVIPIKSSFFMTVYHGMLPEISGLTSFRFFEADRVRRLDSLHRAVGDVVMAPIYRHTVVQAVAEHPLMYLQKTAYQALLYWWIPPKYLSQLTLEFWLVRGVAVIVLNILFVVGLRRLWVVHRTFAVAILLVVSYVTMVYALAHVANVRYKLDIEWLQLFACAAVFQTSCGLATT